MIINMLKLIISMTISKIKDNMKEKKTGNNQKIWKSTSEEG